MNNAVLLKGIVKDFKDNRVLHGIDLTIKEGEVFGLLGPSGAGKTTIVKILTGQLAPTEGEAELFAKSTGSLTGEDYKKIGVMLDNCGLYERLTVYDNMKFFAKIYGVSMQRVDEVLKATGLYAARKTPVMKISKGMTSRLAFARAIMNDADILFLDEPTSGLDPSTAKEIHKILIKQKEQGKTIFLTTHNMSEAQELCDNIALLNKGKIVEYGNPAHICRKYNEENKIVIYKKNGEEVVVGNDAEGAKILGKLMEENQVASMHSTEPNLEAVFIKLTGRGLEADE